MKPILYTNGSSVEWGSELKNKQTERFSYIVAEHWNWIDCNNASSGVSNDYMYRQTMRDVSHWLETNKCWSEESGWVESDELFVIIGWTAPTRFEWWDGEKYQQERLWVGYDKWGENDKDKTTEDQFVLNQTELIPSYFRTFNQIIGLSSFLEKHKIPYYFYNVFYDYNFLNIQSDTKIDQFGRTENQLCFESLWKQLPSEFKQASMYNYIQSKGGGFLERDHPNKESHYTWGSYIIHEIWKKWKEQIKINKV
jgi:hypothetical protein